MRPIVIIGAGGHGREIADIVRHQAQQGSDLAVLGFVDDNQALHGQTIDELPVLGGWSWLVEVEPHTVSVICAVGAPRVSQRLVQRALALGFTFARAISPTAYISPFASIGHGVAIFPHVAVHTGVRIQDYCTLNVGATISHDTVVGQYCNINPGARLAGNVTLGEGCYVGMGAHVIQGRTIGTWTTVGAGAVVIRDLPAHATAVGVPATVIKADPSNA